MVILFELMLVFGLILVASNPSPVYAAFGLVCAAGVGSLLLMSKGGSFLCLVLFLVYLGGMMVVFGYSSSVAAEQYPEAWGGGEVVGYLVGYSLLLGGWWILNYSATEEGFYEVLETVFVGSWLGTGVLYSMGGEMLMVVAWALLLTLFAILEVVQGHRSGALRAL